MPVVRLRAMATVIVALVAERSSRIAAETLAIKKLPFGGPTVIRHVDRLENYKR